MSIGCWKSWGERRELTLNLVPSRRFFEGLVILAPTLTLCSSGEERAFRVTTAFGRLIENAGKQHTALLASPLKSKRRLEVENAGTSVDHFASQDAWPRPAHQQ
jgi:hypothetical protein